MADFPDPTLRLRPLLEARARRVAPSGGSRGADGQVVPMVDPESGGFARERDDVGATGPGVRLPSHSAIGPDGDRIGATGRVPRTIRPDEAPVAAGSDGWVPVWGGENVDHATVPERRESRRRPVTVDPGTRRPPAGTLPAIAGASPAPARGRHRPGAEHREDLPEEDGVGDRSRSADADSADDLSASGAAAARPGLFSGRRPWTRWRERWVPEGPGVRIDPGRRGSALLSVIAIGAVVAAALGLFGSGGTEVGPSAVAVVDGATRVVGTEVAERPPGSASATPVPSASGPDTPTAAPTEVVVAVTGAVLRPGIVTLPVGSRVADAITAAGGVIDGTDYTGLNLAARVADGDSVVVGGVGQGLRSSGSGAGVSGGASTAGDPDALVDLNTADRTALETLPGVGPVMAGNIVSWREANGAFTAVDQLQEITGIGPTRFATLAPLVRVG